MVRAGPLIGCIDRMPRAQVWCRGSHDGVAQRRRSAATAPTPPAPLLIDRPLIASTAAAAARRMRQTCATRSLNPRSHTMPKVTHPAHKKGDALVDYEEKVFEDVK